MLGNSIAGGLLRPVTLCLIWKQDVRFPLISELTKKKEQQQKAIRILNYSLGLHATFMSSLETRMATNIQS